jgi:hypothetical protein
MVVATAMPNAAARLSEDRKREDHQRPVDETDIDLAVAGGRCLDDMQARAEPELDRLPGHRKGAADDRLAGDDSGNSREQDQRHLQRVRAKREERIGAGAALDHDRRLAGIVEQQARQHQPVPGQADRLGAEMAHIGVKRFRSSGAEENGAEHQKAGQAVAEQIGKAVARIERDQHAWMVHDSDQSEHADGDKPQRHDRPEQLADAISPLRLQCKQTHQD